MLKRALLPVLIFLTIFSLLADTTSAVAVSIPPILNMQILKKIETKVVDVHDYLTMHRKVASSLLGLSITMYGGSFRSIMMFLHAFGPAMPKLTTNFEDLIKSYSAARTVYDQEFPVLVNAKGEALRLKRHAEATNHRYTEKELKSLREGEHALRNVIAALNPNRCKEIVGEIYKSAIIGIAAVQNENIALINMGINAGNAAGDRLKELMDNFSPLVSRLHYSPTNETRITKKFSNWNTELLIPGTQALSMGLSFRFKQVAPVFAASIIGSKITTDAIESILEPYTSDLPNGLKLKGKSLLQSGLVFIGCTGQLRSPLEIPTPFKLGLYPLIALEKVLRNKLLNA